MDFPGEWGENSLKWQGVPPMRDDRKTKAQLIEELAELRQKVATLEEARAELDKQAAEARRNSESRYRQLHQSMRDAYAVVDLESRITECNTAFTDMLGYSAAEIHRLTYEDITPEQWHEHEAKIIRDQVFTRGYSDVYEKEYRRKDGTVFPIELRTFLMRDESGNPAGMWAIIRDITRRKRSEAALRHREALLSSMIENMPVDFWARDLEGRLLLQSRQTTEWWGDLQGKPFETAEVPPETLEQWQANNERALRGEVVRGEVQLVTSRGERRDFYNVVAPIITEGEVHGVLGVNLDITDRKRAEQALREGEEKYRALAEKVNDIPYSMDAQGRFTYVGPQVARYGYDPQKMLGQSFLEYIDPQDCERLAEEYQRAMTAGEEFPSVFRIRTPQDHTFWLEDDGHVQRAESGRIVGMAGILRDVTERKEAEQVVLEEQRRLHRLLSMYERDRQLVAYEIHDGFTQPLAGALMQLEGGLQHARSRYPDLPIESCESALKLLRKSIDEARRLMGGLRPAVLEQFGVVPAIENFIDEQRRRNGATIEVTAEVDFDRLEDPLELAIFRIVQEAVANAVNHSGSERIRVALLQQGDRLRIEVQDEGAGFDPARVESGCFGLEGIRVRARLFGGNATIQSAPGQGAHLVVELPLVERAAGPPQESAP